MQTHICGGRALGAAPHMCVRSLVRCGCQSWVDVGPCPILGAWRAAGRPGSPLGCQRPDLTRAGHRLRLNITLVSTIPFPIISHSTGQTCFPPAAGESCLPCCLFANSHSGPSFPSNGHGRSATGAWMECFDSPRRGIAHRHTGHLARQDRHQPHQLCTSGHTALIGGAWQPGGEGCEGSSTPLLWRQSSVVGGISSSRSRCRGSHLLPLCRRLHCSRGAARVRRLQPAMHAGARRSGSRPLAWSGFGGAHASTPVCCLWQPLLLAMRVLSWHQQQCLRVQHHASNALSRWPHSLHRAPSGAL
jgi:hypothetical protein